MTPIMARYMTNRSITRQDKIECAQTLDALEWILLAMTDLTDDERNAAATRKAELMKGPKG